MQKIEIPDVLYENVIEVKERVVLQQDVCDLGFENAVVGKTTEKVALLNVRSTSINQKRNCESPGLNFINFVWKITSLKGVIFFFGNPSLFHPFLFPLLEKVSFMSFFLHFAGLDAYI